MATSTRRPLVFALALGLVALLVRLAFWRATPDAAWAWAACFKGDAPLWLDYARALRGGAEFEAGLPLRPPAMAWLVAPFLPGPGGGFAGLRLLMCLLGAALPPVFFAATLRRFGFGAAALVGALLAASTGLVVLSASLNNETPYLLIVGLTLWLWPGCEGRPRALPLLAWGALQGVGCLLRVEHLLFALAGGAWLTGRARPASGRPGGAGRPRARAAALLLAGFAVTLAPWQATLWARMHALNRVEQPLAPALRAPFEALEEVTGGMPWSPEAHAMRQALPGFGRRAWADLVALHAIWRDRHEIVPEDFRVLSELYGYAPRPLPALPFVALYGPLNFYLAANDSAAAGFSRAGLDRPPAAVTRRLEAPPRLDDVFPYRDGLLPAYPLHLQVLNDGYGLGLRWIAAHPARWVGLVAERARIFWEGAALGVTGWNAPYGLSGVVRKVDLVVPARGVAATLAQLLLLAVCAVGLWRARRRPGALAPWLLFAASRLLVALLFFGYARVGATTIPLVALLVALAFRGVGAPVPAGARRRAARPLLPAVAWALLALALAAEGARLAAPPRLNLGGRAVGGVDPWPVGLYVDQPFRAR